MNEIVGIGFMVLGAAIVITGVVMVVVDWWDGRKAHRHPGVETKRTGAARSINALAHLVRAITGFLKELRKHPAPAQLIIWGMVLILLGLACFALL